MMAIFFASFATVFALLVKAVLVAAGGLLASLFFLTLAFLLAVLFIGAIIGAATEPSGSPAPA